MQTFMDIEQYTYIIRFDGRVISRRAGFESEEAANASAKAWLANGRLPVEVRNCAYAYVI